MRHVERNLSVCGNGPFLPHDRPHAILATALSLYVVATPKMDLEIARRICGCEILKLEPARRHMVDPPARSAADNQADHAAQNRRAGQAPERGPPVKSQLLAQLFLQGVQRNHPTKFANWPPARATTTASSM